MAILLLRSDIPLAGIGGLFAESDDDEGVRAETSSGEEDRDDPGVDVLSMKDESRSLDGTLDCEFDDGVRGCFSRSSV